MKLCDLKGKKVYIYPLSDSSIAFKGYLLAQKPEILGFIDAKKKSLPGIASVSLDEAREFDYILIYSPNHQKEIYDFCVSKVSKEKILCVNLGKDGNFELKNSPKKKGEISFAKSSKYFGECLKKLYTLKDEILFIGYQFVDLNIKYLYFYLLKHSNWKIHLATYNKRDYEMYKNAGFAVTWCDSKEFVDLAFRCKIKIIDQTPTVPFFINALKIGKCVQLWHGITIENLGILANYKVLKYALVLSTSKFVSEYSFSKIYLYDRIIECGYPRNDILRGYESKIFNVDEEILREVKEHKSKFIIYAPTHRAHGFIDNPLDYVKLDTFCEKNSLKLIIKMHPYAAEKLRDDLNFYKANGGGYRNLIIYPPNKDAYVIMKYCDLMIADYSSMYFDFLFVNKPIVFFPYDYEKWVQSEGGVCLDYFAYSPGDKAQNQNELEQIILANLSNDKYKDERERIKKIMFENLKVSSCEVIAKEIGEIL